MRRVKVTSAQTPTEIALGSQHECVYLYHFSNFRQEVQPGLRVEARLWDVGFFSGGFRSLMTP